MSQASGPVATFERPLETIDGLDALVEQVLNACARPVNKLQVAALLESAGITDAGARERYQEPNVFALADAVMSRLAKHARSAERATRVAAPRSLWTKDVADLARGPLSLLPILMVSLTILVYRGFGQWGASQTLTMSMALIGSLLVTSGFVQAISRKGSSYLSQGYVSAGQRIIGQLSGVALVTILATAWPLAVALRTLGWVAPGDVGIMMAAYIATSVMWLIAGVLFLLQRAHWFGLGLAVSLVVTYLCLAGLALTTLPSNFTMLAAALAGMAAQIGVATVVIHKALTARAGASALASHHVTLPPYAQLTVALAPYFTYGVLYVGFILASHVGGWYSIWRLTENRMGALGSFEVGLTLAVGGYILTSGFAERTMRRFWERVQADLSATSQARPAVFNHAMHVFFVREQRYYVLALVGVSAVIYFGMVAITQIFGATGGVIRQTAALPWTAEAAGVLMLGLIGYGLMGLGMFSCMFMITLSRPRLALGAVSIGICVALIVGLAFGAFLPYVFATSSVAAGGLALMLSAQSRLKTLLNHADYYFYASF